MTREYYRLLEEVAREVFEKKKSGLYFNIFSVLAIDRVESIHQKFIYELLSPKGLHGQGDVFCHIFVEQLLRAAKIEANIGGGEILNVTKEYSTKNGKRIDLVVETRKYLIGVEMKIDASDGAGQLYSYYHELEERTQYGDRIPLLYYLTLDGREAGSHSRNGVNSYNISFRNHILKWLDECLCKIENMANLHFSVNQYKEAVRMLTSPREADIDIIDRIKSDPKNLLSGEAISKAFPVAAAYIEEQFFRSLVSQLGDGWSWCWGHDDLMSIPHSERIEKIVGMRKAKNECSENWIFKKIGRTANDLNLTARIGVVTGGKQTKLQLNICQYHANRGWENPNPEDSEVGVIKSYLKEEHGFDIGKLWHFGYKEFHEVELRGSIEGLAEWIDCKKDDERIVRLARDVKDIVASVAEYLEQEGLIQ